MTCPICHRPWAFDPDPLRPPETDAMSWAEQLDAEFDRGLAKGMAERTPLLQATAFGFGVLVGMLAAMVLFFGAAGVR